MYVGRIVRRRRRHGVYMPMYEDTVGVALLEADETGPCRYVGVLDVGFHGRECVVCQC
jgi:hypothetical protein